MKKQLILETDRKSVKEGEFITIKWDCPACPDSLILIFESGYRTDKIAVSDCGSTRIAVPNCKSGFVIRLVAVICGKKVTQEIKVRVSNKKHKTQTGSGGVDFKARREKVYARWCVFRAQMKYWWLSQKKWQKALWIALLVLWLGLLISCFSKTRDLDVTSSQTTYTI